ncbi:MAG: VOC family protein [Erysipelotrichaceae bacterium]|nr:VOC family protein [Erysipelotrichaceae bacterium]
MINFYTCRNLQETEEFWLKMGLVVYMRQPNTIIFDSKEGMVGFVESKEHMIPKYSCISLVVQTKEEVDKRYRELQEYALDKPKVHPTAPVYSFFLMDPNGYKVEFQQFI